MDIKAYITEQIEALDDGNLSGCEAFIIANDLIKLGTELKNKSIGVAIDEASTFNKGESYYGGTWQIRNIADTLDYSKDPEWHQLSEQLKARRAQLTSARKAHANKNIFLNAETGEEITIVPVKKAGGQTIVFTPNKK